MATKIQLSTLNASTLDILNTIRANLSYEYQQYIPEVKSEAEIVKVGDILYGYPALANQFLNALFNRIALVKVKSATFNNSYAEFKKGYLEFGETIEEVFVNIAKAREFSVEKAEKREFKRTLPDVRSAFHTMNYRVQYPITIQQEDLRMAFTNIGGVQDLIARIVDSIYTAAEYDEFLLFKYLIIKAVTQGKMYPVGVNMSDIKNAAKAFRGMSNQLQFMSKKYNAYGVTTTTPKADQYIFMDAQFNAQYDVDVLASAFNMDRATFSGKLMLIDDFTSFDNERFELIRAGSDCMEAVTDAELALMAGVKSILVDREWFQVYDNNAQFTEQYVASGMYWNYFYNVWKTVSSSPFSNAIVFVDSSSASAVPNTLTFKIDTLSDGDDAMTFTLVPSSWTNALSDRNYWFENVASANTNAVIAVHRYGAVMYPKSANSHFDIASAADSSVSLKLHVGDVELVGSVTMYDTGTLNIKAGDTVTFTRTDYVPVTISALSITGVTLSPTFASGTTTYTGTTSNASGTLSYTADDDAEVLVKVGTTEVTGSTLSFASGPNTVTIKVSGGTEDNPETKTYTFTITRS